MRARLWTVAGAILCALALVVGVVWGWVAWTGRQTATIAVPPASSSPLEVAKAYVAALDAHDCSAATSLSTPAASESTAAWCSNVRSLVVPVWGVPRTQAPQWSGHQAPQEVVFITATITVSWRPFHDDGSMSSAAAHRWGYLLVRENSTAPWRVADQGPV